MSPEDVEITINLVLVSGSVVGIGFWIGNECNVFRHHEEQVKLATDCIEKRKNNTFICVSSNLPKGRYGN